MHIIHSESALFGLSLLLGIAVFLSLLLSAALAVGGNFPVAKRIARTTLGGFVVWIVIANLITLLTPRTIVNVGETYCMDIDCLGIDAIESQAHSTNTTYKLKTHFYSDANTVKISFKNVAYYLVDERGRRFPRTDDPSAPPYDTLLDPGQSIKTTLTFEVAPDVRQLFLTWEGTPPPSVGGKKPPSWALPFLVPVGLAMYGGGGFLVQKQAVLRVL
jgi:hypothetical protein